MTYQLYHGDCLEILPQIADNSIDAVICDPPYGTTACKWDSVIPFEPMWTQLKRIIKPRGAIVLFGSQPFTSALVMSNPKWFKYRWAWDKTRGRGHLVSNVRPMEQLEDICVFGNGGVNYYPIKKKRDKPIYSKEGKSRTVIVGGKQPDSYDGRWLSDKQPTTLLTFAPPTKYVHPTQKPVSLLEYLVRTYTNAGDTVLDFTFGSNTTGVACVNTGRNYIGIEKDAGYFEIGKRRIEEATDPLARMVA